MLDDATETSVTGQLPLAFPHLQLMHSVRLTTSEPESVVAFLVNQVMAYGSALRGLSVRPRRDDEHAVEMRISDMPSRAFLSLETELRSNRSVRNLRIEHLLLKKT